MRTQFALERMIVQRRSRPHHAFLLSHYLILPTLFPGYFAAVVYYVWSTDVYAVANADEYLFSRRLRRLVQGQHNSSNPKVNLVV